MTRSLSLAVALGLAAVCAGGGRRRGPGAHLVKRRWVAIAAGASVAYVFVDVLPELAVRHAAFVESSGEGLLFAGQRIYLAALVGFIVFYGLEHMVLVSRVRGRVPESGGTGDTVYWLHVGGFAAYSWLIGYLVVEREAAGAPALAVYGVAMALHFQLVGHALREEHGGVYERVGRWVLAGGVVAGWLVGATTPVSHALISPLFGLVVGGVVITSVKAELPRDGEGQFGPFSLAAVAYALLLLAT